MSQTIPLTKESFDFLQEDLKRLIKEERPKVIQDIAEARAHGDLSENAEYDAAKNRQGFIEGRIIELKDKLARLHSVVPLFAPEVKKVGGQPVMENGRPVVLRPGIVYAPDRAWSDMVITEVGMFPKGKRDDLCDTVSMALRYMRDIGLLQLAPERLAEVEESKQFETVKHPQPLYPG